MDDLPELPFEKVMSYLPLKDRIRSRCVSRSWRSRFDNYPLQSLCFSELPSGCIMSKHRFVTGGFAENFIQSLRLDSFINTFRQSILGNLKQLRLCDLRLEHMDEKAFAPSLNSLDQLEELNIIRFRHVLNWQMEPKLTLPMLHSIHLEEVSTMKNLTLDAARLKKIRLVDCFPLRLHLVHNTSVERLLVDSEECVNVRKLKSLKCLCANFRIDSTILSNLQQLKELHMDSSYWVSRAFEHAPANLKIYFSGSLMKGPDDLQEEKTCFEYLDENMDRDTTRLADEIPFNRRFYYTNIESIPLERQVIILSKFTDLREVLFSKPVQDVQRLLDLLKSLDSIVVLRFLCDQPQDLYDRLPEHSAIQSLDISGTLQDYSFLLRLKHLVHLELRCLLTPDWIRMLFQELEFLLTLKTDSIQMSVTNQIGSQKPFKVQFDRAETGFPGLNTALQFIAQIFNRKIFNRERVERVSFN